MPKCPFCDKVVAHETNTCPYCRAPLADSPPHVAPDQNLEQRIRLLLDQGQKISAVKLYREETGSSLLDAKIAVEALEAGGPLPPRENPVDGDWEAEVLRLLGGRNKIQAIKLYRQRMGGGLKEAKQAVEALGMKHGIAVRGSGCLGVLTLALIALAIVLALAGR